MDNKTVFVIGAGASKEANLPTGYELKGRIAKLLDMRFEYHKQEHGDYQIVEALRALVRTDDGRNGDINPYLHEAWHIRDALPQAISIDNFIDSQRGNEKIAICGKLGIVRSILEAEKESILYFDKFESNSGMRFNKLENTWYLPFFQILTENCEIKDLKDRLKSIAVIIFNYDRCLEHFLYFAFQNYYRISGKESADLIEEIGIYHPYGSIGSLPWCPSDEVVEFGAESNGHQLLGLISQIKTFAEGTDPSSSDIIAIRNHMSEARKVVFIGFAFHKLNMNLISPNGSEVGDRENPKCFATTYGISENDKEVISDQLDQLYKANIDMRMVNLECNKFFAEFWRSLAF